MGTESHRYRDLWASDFVVTAWVVSDVMSLAFIAVCTAHLNKPIATTRKITMGLLAFSTIWNCIQLFAAKLPLLAYLLADFVTIGAIGFFAVRNFQDDTRPGQDWMRATTGLLVTITVLHAISMILILVSMCVRRWCNLPSSGSSRLRQAIHAQSQPRKSSGPSNNSFEFERILADLRHIETQHNGNNSSSRLRPYSAVLALDSIGNARANVRDQQLLGRLGPRGLLTFDQDLITFPSAIARRPLAGEHPPQYSLTDITCPPPYCPNEPKKPKELNVPAEEV